MKQRTEYWPSKYRATDRLTVRSDVQARRDRGACAHHAGRAAEEQVKAMYLRRGLQLCAERWRGCSGEIDLIFSGGSTLVFVEVKRSASFERAIGHLRPAQLRRIFAAAEEYLGRMPNGSLTEMRIDLALVDGQGTMHITENLMLE